MLLSFIRLALRLFYRRIVYVGLEHVSASAPVLFVLNHPNALVDPLFVLDAVRRPVHFLAKAPLLQMPLAGRAMRRGGVLPIYRVQDGADPRQNERTFGECHRVLARGESVAIFPEGTTHSDAALRPLKTGAARIALGAEAVASFTLGLEIVPVGLQYEAKDTFRSDVTVWFGEAHRVTDLADCYARDPGAAVLEETRRLGVALHDVTVNVGRQELLELMTATAIFAAGAPSNDADAAVLRRQFLEGYAWFSRTLPDRLARIRRALARHASVLALLGLTTHDLRTAGASSSPGLAFRVLATVPMLLLAGAGVVFEWVPYNLVDAIARRTTRDEPELRATAKLLAAFLFYPTWWAVTALAVGWISRWWVGAAVLVSHPVIAYLAMSALERLERFRRGLQVFRLASRRRRLERLRRHERAIGQELQALASLYQAGDRS